MWVGDGDTDGDTVTVLSRVGVARDAETVAVWVVLRLGIDDLVPVAVSLTVALSPQVYV